MNLGVAQTDTGNFSLPLNGKEMHSDEQGILLLLGHGLSSDCPNRLVQREVSCRTILECNAKTSRGISRASTVRGIKGCWP